MQKEKHAYRVSYALDVGSSFDPDMEDPRSWEDELRCTLCLDVSVALTYNHISIPCGLNRTR